MGSFRVGGLVSSLCKQQKLYYISVGLQAAKRVSARSCSTMSLQHSFSAPWHRLSKVWRSTGGMNSVLLKDIPSFGDLVMVVETTL